MRGGGGLHLSRSTSTRRTPDPSTADSTPRPRVLANLCQAREVSYSDVVWLPNALILTALLGAFAVWRWRTKGAFSGLRWTGVALLPLALYGIGLYRLVWSVGLAGSRFVSGFVF